ncbi:MAG: thermonuclease family protein [Thermoleophilia bacterium]|nr:thermonuclease family protein [Thermoleophilia bacterium]MDH5332238.1 thermonuclease family protein [Thermoleophilia bacterium]
MGPHRLILALAALAVLLAGSGCESSRVQPPAGVDSGVVRVVGDGDTLTLDDGRTIRLVQIDAPEAADECYGREATAALVRLAPRGTLVELERDPRLDDVDVYDRLLRYVLVDGENVNLELVREGAAAPYFFRGDRGRYADELLDAARRARAADRGFWGACPGARLDPGRGSLTGRR